MGRGLSEQQRDILAIAVAINAHRNGGEPRPAEIEVERRAPYHHYPHWVLARSEVDLFDNLLLVAVAGYRPGGKEWITVAGGWKNGPTSCSDRMAGQVSAAGAYAVASYMRLVRYSWDQSSICHKRRVSLDRAVRSLVDRELLLFAPGVSSMRSCHDELRPLCREIEREFEQSGAVSRGYYLTAAGLAAAGDRWQQLDALQLVEHWETARRVRRYR